MSTAPTASRRIRTFAQFVAAVLYFLLARSIAYRAAALLADPDWAPLVAVLALAFLLLLGYAGMGFWLDSQLYPVADQGWPRRAGWHREAGKGLAVGWTLAVVCVLPMALIGGISTSIFFQLSAWGWLLADLAFFALVALTEEVAFRGYGFQRVNDAVGPVRATLVFTVLYAILQGSLSNSNRVSIAVACAFGILLSIAYLRTRALWLSWGLNFAWKASRALVFGLAVNGSSSHSPIVQGDPMGPIWLSGGSFGLDGSWFAFFLLLAAVPVLYRITRDLDFQHNAPVIVPGGLPVDLGGAARQAAETAAATASQPTFVQIQQPNPPAADTEPPVPQPPSDTI
jgi:hypothetical protein